VELIWAGIAWWYARRARKLAAKARACHEIAIVARLNAGLPVTMTKGDK